MLINLTPHTVVLRDATGADHLVPPSGTVARVANTPGPLLGVVEGIPVIIHAPDAFGDVEGLPPPREGCFFVVSALVGAAVRGRPDVLVLGTGPQDGAVRKDGQVVAVTRLKRTAP